MNIAQITGQAVVLTGNDIDTDQIIPGRFLKCVTFDHLADGLFYDQRFDEKGQPKAHPFNDPKFQGASLLISDHHFGCGSSREHAPQALKRHGIKGLICGSYAEIFYHNCANLGLPCAIMADEDRAALKEYVDQHPKAELTLDIATERLSSKGGPSWPLRIKSAQKNAFLQGTYDPLNLLLGEKEAVLRLAQRVMGIKKPPV